MTKEMQEYSIEFWNEQKGNKYGEVIPIKFYEFQKSDILQERIRDALGVLRLGIYEHFKILNDKGVDVTTDYYRVPAPDSEVYS